MKSPKKDKKKNAKIVLISFFITILIIVIAFGLVFKDKKEKEAKSESKMSYIGDGILREYSDTMPTYSKTLDVWEIHKGLDVSAQEGSEIKSILDGKVVSVYSDDKYGTSIELSYNDDLKVIYSGIQENVSL